MFLSGVLLQKILTGYLMLQNWVLKNITIEK